MNELYDLLEFVECYIGTKLNTEMWDNMEVIQKIKYVAEALRQIKSIDGINLPDELPKDVKMAVSEVCLDLVNYSDSEQFKKLQDAGVTSISYGNDSVSFSQNASTSKTSNSCINDFAYFLLRPFIQRSYRIV